MTEPLTRGALEKLRVVDLKELLASHELSVTGRKADLIDRLVLHEASKETSSNEDTPTNTTQNEEKISSPTIEEDDNKKKRSIDEVETKHETNVGIQNDQPDATNEEEQENSERQTKQQKMSSQHTIATEEPIKEKEEDFMISTDTLNQLLPPLPEKQEAPTIPQSNREATDTLLVASFAQPLTIESARQFFENVQGIHVVDIWIKESVCYVKLESPEQASRVRNEVYGKTHESSNPLVADFVENYEMEAAKNTKMDETDDDPLELLFKKTVTKPSIYYLPLTEEQVAEKKQRRRRGVSLYDIEEQKTKKDRVYLDKASDDRYDRRRDDHRSSRQHSHDRRR